MSAEAARALPVPLIHRPAAGREAAPCRPLAVLRRLMLARALPRFLRAVGQPPSPVAGHCGRIAEALLFDLFQQKDAARGWRMCRTEGTTLPYVRHYWLECDGWAVDASDGACVIEPLTTYRARIVTGTVQTWSAREWARAQLAGERP